MSEMPRLSELEEVILELLYDRLPGEMYGSEMVSADPKIKRGSIYVMLDRMSEKGLVESRKLERQPGERGLPKRLYKITGLGQRVLAAHRAARGAAHATWNELNPVLTRGRA